MDQTLNKFISPMKVMIINYICNIIMVWVNKTMETKLKRIINNEAKFNVYITNKLNDTLSEQEYIYSKIRCILNKCNKDIQNLKTDDLDEYLVINIMQKLSLCILRQPNINYEDLYKSRHLPEGQLYDEVLYFVNKNLINFNLEQVILDVATLEIDFVVLNRN